MAIGVKVHVHIKILRIPFGCLVLARDEPRLKLNVYSVELPTYFFLLKNKSQKQNKWVSSSQKTHAKIVFYSIFIAAPLLFMDVRVTFARNSLPTTDYIGNYLFLLVLFSHSVRDHHRHSAPA